MKTGFFIHRIYTGPAVTGTDKMPGFHIDPAGTLPDLSLEKIIVGNIFPRFIITHIQMIEPDKRFHCCCRNPGIQKLSHNRGNSRGNQRPDHHTPGHRTVDFFQQIILKRIFLFNVSLSVCRPDHKLPPLSMENL